MKTTIAFLLTCMLAVSSTVLAQTDVIVYDDFVLHNGRTTVSNGAFVSVDRSNTIGFDVSITGTAVVMFRVSGVGRFGWNDLNCFPSDNETPVTSTGTSGFYQCNVAGADVVSARLDTCTGCTVTVIARRTTAILGGGGGGGGSPTTWASLLATGAMGTSETVPFQIRGVGGQANNGRNIYQSSSGVWFDVCVVAGVENACNYIRKLAATYYFEIQNASGTSIFRVSNDTGAITNATIDGEGTGNIIVLTEENWWDVAACQNVTAQIIFNLPTANTPTPNCEGTNTRIATADFNDTTDQSITFRWVLPIGFTGAIDIKFKWKAVSTTGNVGWCAQLVKVSGGSTSDPSVPAQASGNCGSDPAQGTTLQENDFTLTGVTCTSCSGGDAINVTISRDANGSAVTDSMTGDAKLLNFGRVWRVAH